MKNYGDRGGASTDNTLLDLHNSSYDTKASFSNFLLCYLHRSIDVKFIFDSACLRLFSFANILQISSLPLRVVFLLLLPCFWLFFRIVRTLETSEMSAIFQVHNRNTSTSSQVFSVNGSLTSKNAAFLSSFPC